MTATPKTHAVQVRKAAEAKKAFTPRVTRLAYSTSTGDAPRTPEVCPEIAKGHEHGIFESVADLPGDRSIGYCICGAYVDTGVWSDDRA